MWIITREARSRGLAACLCLLGIAAIAFLTACTLRSEVPVEHAPAATDPAAAALDVTGTPQPPPTRAAGAGPTVTPSAASQVPPVETPSELTITGTVMDTSLSAHVIHLEEAAQGCAAIALTEETKLVSAAGSEIALREIHRGGTVKAFGCPGSSNALIASRVILLDAPPPPGASPALTTAPGPAPTQAPLAAPSPLPPLRPTPAGQSEGTSVIRSFSAAPQAGEAILLTWDALGEEATLCPLIGDAPVSCRCLFGLPPEGSVAMRAADVIGAYTGFRLTVETDGVRTVGYAPLMMACPDRFPDWFFDEPAGMCPKDIPLRSYAASQRFERGQMFWVEALDTFYVLLDHDENVSRNSTDWSSLTSLRIVRGPLELKPGAAPDNRVEEMPPPGLFEPVSGFGLVWRGDVEGTEDIRAALGWAEEPEYGFDAVYQCEMSCGAHWDCYLQGPKGEVFHLFWLLHIGHFWEPVDRDQPRDGDHGLEGR